MEKSDSANKFALFGLGAAALFSAVQVYRLTRRLEKA